MPVDLHLFSNPGISNIGFILEACRPYLEVQARPVLAFMQWASVNRDWLDYTQKSFAGIAEVAAFVPDPALRQKNQQILDLCGVVYISGGNTFLLNHLLHTSDLIGILRKRAADGLPIVGFSAGAIVCGPNILTTHDINLPPTTYFDSLDLLPFNIAAHYPAEESARVDEDDWLSDYHSRHTNPILGLENDAYIRWDGKTLKRVRGASWIIEIGKSRFYLG